MIVSKMVIYVYYHIVVVTKVIYSLSVFPKTTLPRIGVFFSFFFLHVHVHVSKGKRAILLRKKIKYVGSGCPMCTMQAETKGLLGSFLMNNIKDPPSSPVKDSSLTSLVFLFPSSPPEGSFLFHLSTSLYIFPSIFNSA